VHRVCITLWGRMEVPGAVIEELLACAHIQPYIISSGDPLAT